MGIKKMTNEELKEEEIFRANMMGLFPFYKTMHEMPGVNTNFDQCGGMLKAKLTYGEHKYDVYVSKLSFKGGVHVITFEKNNSEVAYKFRSDAEEDISKQLYKDTSETKTCLYFMCDQIVVTEHKDIDEQRYDFVNSMKMYEAVRTEIKRRKDTPQLLRTLELAIEDDAT